VKIELKHLDRYMFVDPAGRPRGNTGGLRRQRARQAIVVIGVDWLNRVFVLDSWAGRLPASQFVSKIVEVYTRWTPRSCGIEENAMQELFADLVKDEARRQLGHVNMRGITQPTNLDKDWRIRNHLEPVINQGRLFLVSGNAQVDLETEIRTFPTGRTKDLVDALASAVSMAPARTSHRAVNQEVEDVLRYLRDTGAPMWYIQQRSEELKQEAKLALRPAEWARGGARG